jgi:hypothetical protein
MTDTEHQDYLRLIHTSSYRKKLLSCKTRLCIKLAKIISEYNGPSSADEGDILKNMHVKCALLIVIINKFYHDHSRFILIPPALLHAVKYSIYVDHIDNDARLAWALLLSAVITINYGDNDRLTLLNVVSDSQTLLSSLILTAHPSPKFRDLINVTSVPENIHHYNDFQEILVRELHLYSPLYDLHDDIYTVEAEYYGWANDETWSKFNRWMNSYHVRQSIYFLLIILDRQNRPPDIVFNIFIIIEYILFINLGHPWRIN